MDSEGMRAPRFPLDLSLRYRLLGETVWREGRTVNISRTGVLFRAEDLPQVDAPVEVSFVVPLADLAVEVLCHGRIVRTIPPTAPDLRLGLAATIGHYRFVRGQASAG